MRKPCANYNICSLFHANVDLDKNFGWNHNGKNLIIVAISAFLAITASLVILFILLKRKFGEAKRQVFDFDL